MTTHHPHAHSTTTDPDPRALLGNPARQFPAQVPLDADQVFAGTVPSAPPMPFKDAAGPDEDMAERNADYQAWDDWTGVIDKIATAKKNAQGAEPSDTVLKQIAYRSGVTFTYRGQKYLNKTDGGVWIPG